MVAPLVALAAGLLAVGYAIWPLRRAKPPLGDELAGFEPEAVAEAAAAALRAWSGGSPAEERLVDVAERDEVRVDE